MKKKSNWNQLNIIAVAVLLTGLLMTIAAAAYVSSNNREHITTAVSGASKTAIKNIKDRITLYQYGLRGARGTILTAGEDGITREKFAQYSNTRDVDEEFPGARGFGFIRRVLPQEEDDFIARARQDGAPDFRIRQLSPHSDERYIIQYIEPVSRNIQAVGLDIGSETNRRTAADDAMKTGTVQLTGPITLVQATGNPQQSFLILMPITRPGMPLNTLKERVSATYGWSYAPLLMEEVMADLDIYDGTFYLELKDITDAKNPVLFFNNMETPDDGQKEYETLANLDIFGRKWAVAFRPTTAFIHKLNQSPPEIVLISGIIASIALTVLVAVVSASQRNKRVIAEQQVKLASIVESSFDAVIGRDLNGIITSWNPGAAKLFGYLKEEALGQSFIDILVPDSLRKSELEIQAKSAIGEALENFETQIRHRDGHLIDLFVTASPIHSQDGEIIGSSMTMRDFTIQKEAKKRINELNIVLENSVAERTAELTSVNSLLTSILRAATKISIIATNEKGIITVFNSGAENLYGYSTQNVVGKVYLNALFHKEELEKYADKIEQVYGERPNPEDVLFYEPRNGNTHIQDWHTVCKDGSSFVSSSVISEIRNDDGRQNGFLCVSTDVTEQRNFRQQLETAHTQLQMAADVAELGVWSWEVNDNSLHWNDQMFAIYGHPLSLKKYGLSYEHWRSKLHPDDASEIAARLSATLEGTGDFNVTFRVIPSPGKVRFVQAGAFVLRDENGKAIRITGFNRDATDQKQRELLLQHAKDDADRASVAKSHFVANMSHEIRTPMNAVLGMLQLTQQTNLTERQRDFLNKAQGAAKTMLCLLNDILDYSKIEAGKLDVETREFDLHELFTELGAILYGSHQNTDVDIIFDLAPDVPRILNGDAMRLQQILTNLAGNALKFTKQGRVTISVSEQMSTAAESCTLRFCIEDTGIGISKDQLSRLFQGFTQAETSTSRQFGGTGLGLVISDRLVSMMGGTIMVESEPDIGSQFVFTLPFGCPNALKTMTPPRLASTDRVLLFSTQDQTANVYRNALNRLGFDVILETSASALASTITTNSANQTLSTIVIDEFGLPESEAEILQTQIKQTAVENVIVLSQAQDKNRLGEKNCLSQYKHLEKPFTAEQLSHTIALGLERGKQDTVTPDLSTQAAQQALKGLNLLVVEDNELNRLVAQELFEGEGATVDLANSGAEGVEKALAADQNYSFVIMDVQMPGMDGLEATRIIRKSKNMSELPIIAMTANASLSDQQECLAAGMNLHISKPIDLEEVVQILTHFDRG